MYVMRRDELAQMVFHGQLGFVAAGEVVLFGAVAILGPGETVAAAKRLGRVVAGLIAFEALVVAGYHFICADVHRRCANGE